MVSAEEFVARHIHDDLPFTEKDDAIGQVERLIQIMRDKEHGCLDAYQKLAEHILHFGPGKRIERAKGFVHQQNAGFGGESAR